MRLAKVIGQVVATVRSERLGMDKLALIKFIDQDGNEESSVMVAADRLGAGEGEWVLVVSGSSARMSVDGTGQTPVDLSIVGIIDEVTGGTETWFKKYQRNY
ncbi:MULTISPECIES: EutN/CcmL family microcompartment protein [Marinobacter]|uniref:Ethanolamine utilization protein EutN n=3 Tax=Marinobacter TaxID=2742 RepID=A0A558BFJ0_9GAMM|nr:MULTISPECIES: EutN/CcmL family microcompartment protein [Marinobacter]ABM18324.1 Ethanolamine utilization protein EutN/carboxysome structural protein Ccml [Marinobacter nauticus VT8]TVT35277.1 MAG: ethanolamine utilization protein EutN [Marinobacter vinifirmus]